MRRSAYGLSALSALACSTALSNPIPSYRPAFDMNGGAWFNAINATGGTLTGTTIDGAMVTLGGKAMTLDQAIAQLVTTASQAGQTSLANVVQIGSNGFIPKTLIDPSTPITDPNALKAAVVNVAFGVAPLDGNSQVPMTNLPLAITSLPNAIQDTNKNVQALATTVAGETPLSLAGRPGGFPQLAASSMVPRANEHGFNGDVVLNDGSDHHAVTDRHARRHVPQAHLQSQGPGDGVRWRPVDGRSPRWPGDDRRRDHDC